jgi:hypothetical protein
MKKREKNTEQSGVFPPTFHRYQKMGALLFNEERPIFEEQL